jgi:monolysocardiolipin acyltransferase
MSGHDDLYQNAERSSLFWTTLSYQTILTVASLSRAFLSGLNNVEVHGLPRFLDLLKSRCDYRTRKRGLLTVSNHISVMDDPLIWGVLPLSFHAYHGYMNHRWSLGSHDICFKNAFASHFFTLGQTLPVHRSVHSPFGGPFQATMTEAVRMLGSINAHTLTYAPHNNPRLHEKPHDPSWPRDCIDPFSDLPISPSYPSQPNDHRFYLAPSRYASNSYSWIHIFPEGMIHQSYDFRMRYFKWGVSRLILEPEECPDVVPMFIEGTDQIMHESRTWPRFVPRAGKKVVVTFGKEVDTNAVFGDLRSRWRKLAEEDARRRGSSELSVLTHGIVPESLQNHPEAMELRIECAKRVRDQILQLRRERGYPDEDPKATRADTWLREGPDRRGKMKDGTWVGDT